ncbi:MAG: tetratricopeptide repeat protein [Acidobacteria bacterium]|nr:tetratricopeptide repeat protein [Acidobacteriota bacterium]
MRDISPAERRELLKSQTGKLKETLAQMSLIEAEEALEEGDTATAISALYDAIKNFPENPFYYIKLSEVFQSENKVHDAIKVLTSALKHCPTNPVIKAKIAELEIVNKNAKNNALTQANTPNSVSNSATQTATQILSDQATINVKSKYAKLSLPSISNPQTSESSAKEDKTVPLVKTLTKTQLERRERKKELKSQTGRLKETLAEMSLIESEECLERGDRLGAINSLQDAIRNYPENPTYYLKLAELQAQDSKVTEAIKLLNTALEYAPQHPELISKLNELEESIKPKTIAPPQVASTQELKEVPAEVLADIDAYVERSKITNQKQSTIKFNVNKLLCPKCNTINDINSAKCANCNTPLSRFNKLRLKSQETILELQNRIKARDIAILISIAIIIVISFPLARRENAIVVEPLEPSNESTLDLNNAEFQWDTTTENIGFLLIIEKDNKKIIERYTSNLVYTLTYEESGRLQANEVYKWQVVPVSPKRKNLNFRTKQLEFRVAPLNSRSNSQENNQKSLQGKNLD